MNEKIFYELLDKNSKNFPGTVFPLTNDFNSTANTKTAFALGMPVSRRCNLKCKFCYTDTHNQNSQELNLSERIDLLDQAKEAGIVTIMTAMSGEAFCDPDFFKILEYSKKLGFNYFLFTNLTMITKEIAKYIYSHNVGILGSCHSINEKTYENLTQIKGSFNKMIQGAQNLLDAGYTTNNFLISWVVCKSNQNEFDDMINYWANKGIKVFPEYCNITGAGNRYQNEIYFPYEEYLNLREKYNAKYVGYNLIPPLTYNNKCYSGLFGIIVGIDGTLYRCWDPGKSGILGNIKETKLTDVIKKKYINPCFCPGYDECVGRNVK